MAFLKPDAREVLVAIESLYVDQLKPFGRILRKRLAERAAPEIAEAQLRGEKVVRAPDSRRSSKSSTGSSQKGGRGGGGGRREKANALPEVDVDHLKAICDASPHLLVQPEDGGDWSATFKGRADPFIDIYSTTDTFSETFWAVATVYFGGLKKEDMSLPGGRYSCAQMLVYQELPFLASLTLGQVCHFVQLAISKRKVLGYLDGSVVPYAFSQSMVKEQSALLQQSCASSGVAARGQDISVAAASAAPGAASWSVARACLNAILAEAAAQEQQSPATVPLSNIKRLFSSTYNLELSETALGHSKLSELLQDERFSDVCSVQLQKQGYLVVWNEESAKRARVPSVAQALKAEAEAAQLADQEEEQEEDAEEDASMPRRVRFCPDEPLGLELEDAGCGLVAEDLTPPAAMAIANVNTPLRSPGVPPSCTVRKWTDAPAAVPAEPAALPLLPLPPVRVVSQEQPAAGTLYGEPRRVIFCPGEPLIFNGEMGIDATPEASPGVPASTTVRGWNQDRFNLGPAEPADMPRRAPPPSPPAAVPTTTISEEASAKSPGVRWKVHNTFIQAASQPPTPLPGARRRAKSVPKDMVVDHDVFAVPLGAIGGQELVGSATFDSAASTTDSAGSGQIPVPPSPSSSASGARPRMVPDAGTPLKVQLDAGSSLRSIVAFCSDEPLCFEEAGIFIEDDFTEAPQQQRGREENWSVQNTFIHQALPPLTPAPGAKVRARSVPKDVGSEARPHVALGRQQIPVAGAVAKAVPTLPPSPALMPPTPQTPYYRAAAAAAIAEASFMPPTPQTPFYNGAADVNNYAWAFPPAAMAPPLPPQQTQQPQQPQRVLLLSDHL